MRMRVMVGVMYEGEGVTLLEQSPGRHCHSDFGLARVFAAECAWGVRLNWCEVAGVVEGVVEGRGRGGDWVWPELDLLGRGGVDRAHHLTQVHRRALVAACMH